MNTEAVSISAALTALLSSGVALVAILWPNRLTPEQTAAIVVFGNTVIITAGAILARRNVWSRQSVEAIQAKAAVTGSTESLPTPP